jgi:rubrerythrin
MIELKPDLAQGLEDPTKLRTALQAAVELEHATIPTYLYALYSLRPGFNKEIAILLRSVVLEEMTHMALACNILNAIGGEPCIDDPSFLPRYPGPLPGSVESGLTVPLSRFTPDLVSGVFMMIEEPERPLEYRAEVEQATPPLTIGEFYGAIAAQLQNSNQAIFTRDHSRQVTHDLKAELIEVVDLPSALNAIEMIVEQGEGTTRLPTDEEGELAHYYRFAEIHYGRRLVSTNRPDAPPDERYAYSGEKILFDPDGVVPLVLNPRTDSYATNTQARNANITFNYTYTGVLKTLHATFNGRPDLLMTAVGLMESCKQQALDMGAIEVANSSTPPAREFAGPSFEYQATNP